MAKILNRENALQRVSVKEIRNQRKYYKKINDETLLYFVCLTTMNITKLSSSIVMASQDYLNMNIHCPIEFIHQTKESQIHSNLFFPLLPKLNAIEKSLFALLSSFHLFSFVLKFTMQMFEFEVMIFYGYLFTLVLF